MIAYTLLRIPVDRKTSFCVAGTACRPKPFAQQTKSMTSASASSGQAAMSKTAGPCFRGHGFRRTAVQAGPRSKFATTSSTPSSQKRLQMGSSSPNRACSPSCSCGTQNGGLTLTFPPRLICQKNTQRRGTQRGTKYAPQTNQMLPLLPFKRTRRQNYYRDYKHCYKIHSVLVAAHMIALLQRRRHNSTRLLHPPARKLVIPARPKNARLGVPRHQRPAVARRLHTVKRSRSETLKRPLKLGVRQKCTLGLRTKVRRTHHQRQALARRKFVQEQKPERKRRHQKNADRCRLKSAVYFNHIVVCN